MALIIKPTQCHTLLWDPGHFKFGVTSSMSALSTGSQDCAVLQYKFTGEKEVDLMSTFVPETFRGQGVAAVLSQVRVHLFRYFRHTMY